VSRPALAQKLKEAVAQGDLKENADYHDTKEKQGLVEARIAYLQGVLRSAHIVESPTNDDRVSVGSTVRIREEGFGQDEVFQIVGSAEANPADGKISPSSPIGAALVGRQKGEIVVATTPAGKLRFKILEITA
jgi:transcription elongation factor GreA